MRFNGPRFGFASRNFYAEFLAATDVERDYRKHFGDVQRKPPLRFDTVTVERYTPYRTLVRTAGIDAETFRQLNPSYHDPVVAGRLYVPAGDTIRLPPGQAASFRVAYAQLGANETYARQRQQVFSYRVRKGESLASIAQRFGTSEGTLRGMNGLKKKSRLRAGKVLRIPNNGDDVPELASASEREETVAIVEPRAKPQRAAGQREKAGSNTARTHKVKSGQTLSGIAERYNVSVSQLKRENNLSKTAVIKPGMKLKIPS